MNTHPNFVPIPDGTIFNSWTVHEHHQHGTYRCTCICGLEKQISAVELRSGKRKACRSCSTRRPDSGFREVLSSYRGNAKRRDLDFRLSEEQVLSLLSSPCSYCGLPHSMSCKEIKYNGIDRRNNSLGYIIENCVPCCKICNHMKCELTEEEFLAHVKRIREHRSL